MENTKPYKIKTIITAIITIIGLVVVGGFLMNSNSRASKELMDDFNSSVTKIRESEEAYKIGLSFLKEKNYVEAELYLQTALDKGFLPALVPLSEAEFYQNKLEESEDHLLKSLRIAKMEDLFYAKAHLDLGNIYHKKGDYLKAKQSWKKAATLGSKGAKLSLIQFADDLN